MDEEKEKISSEEDKEGKEIPTEGEVKTIISEDPVIEEKVEVRTEVEAEKGESLIDLLLKPMRILLGTEKSGQNRKRISDLLLNPWKDLLGIETKEGESANIFDMLLGPLEKLLGVKKKQD